MNILLSSYDFHEEWAQEIMRPLLKQDMKVVVIPFSFDDKEVKTLDDYDQHYGINGKHVPYILRPFHYYGLYDIEFVDYFRDSQHIAQKKVMSADILFLTGGLPDQYLKRLNEFRLSEMIRCNHQLIIGASAGAMVQFDQYHITPDDDYPCYHYQKGLGLVSGFEIEVHYCHSAIQDASIQRVIEERGLPTYTIGNDGGLFYHQQKIISFGNAHLINNPQDK
jgi:cyanophycinase